MVLSLGGIHTKDLLDGQLEDPPFVRFCIFKYLASKNNAWPIFSTYRKITKA